MQPSVIKRQLIIVLALAVLSIYPNLQANNPIKEKSELLEDTANLNEQNSLNLSYKSSSLANLNSILLDPAQGCPVLKVFYNNTEISYTSSIPIDIDATVAQWAGDANYANRNFGANINFEAITWTSSSLIVKGRSFIYFNIAGLPPTGMIKNAKLVLSGNNHNDGLAVSSPAFYIVSVPSLWDENSITWNNQPSGGGYSLLYPGPSPSNNYYQNYYIDVKNFIYNWQAGQPNYGLMMMLQTESTYRKIKFKSSDHTDVASRPRVDIELYGSGTKIIEACLGDQVQLRAEGFTSYSWSPAAGLSCTTCANPTLTVTEDATYTVTGYTADGCSATFTFAVLVTNPSINKDYDVEICEGESATLYTIVDQEGGTYSWIPTTGLSCTNCANPVASPDQTTTYTVTYTLGTCSASDQLTATVHPLPFVEISNDWIEIECGEGEAVLQASIYGGGNGRTYLWSPSYGLNCTTCVNPLATPKQNTVYRLQYTDSYGCSNISNGCSVMVTPNNHASISTDRSTVTCTNPSANLTVSSGASYLWSTGATTQSISVTPSSTTIYTVTVTESDGCTSVAQQTIVADKTPPASGITADRTYLTCTYPTATLTANGIGTYLWSTGATTQAITVSPETSTTYNVTVTGSNGCTATSSQIISTNKTFQPTIWADRTTVTCTNPSALLVTGGGTYLWSTGETTVDITVAPLTNTTYTVTVTGDNGCVGTASQLITANKPAPPAAISANRTTVTCSNPSATLTASGGTSYLWNTGATNASITVTPSSNTTYTVTVTGSTGCTASVSQLITLDQTPPTVSITADRTIVTCTYPSATLTANGGTSYLWSTGATTQAITVTPTGNTTYSVTVTGSNGCTAITSQLITVDKTPPNALIEYDDNYLTCNIPSTWLLVDYESGTTHLWSTGETSDMIYVSPTSNTTYSLTVTGSNGCTATASQLITVDKTPPPASITANRTTVTCTNPSATLTASGGTSYLWSTGATTASVIVTPTSNTTYTVTVTGSNGCVAVTSQLISVDQTPPIASITADHTTIGCTYPSATLTANGGSGYLWSTGAVTQIITVTPSTNTTYTVTVTGSNGCTDDASQLITVAPVPIVNAGNDASICKGNSTLLNAIPNGSGTMQWTPATGLSCTTCSNPIANPTITTTYTVTFTNIFDCIATDNVTVNVSQGITLQYDNEVCNGEVIQLVASGASSYTWTPAQYFSCTSCSNPVIQPASTMSYRVVGAADANGCSDAIDFTITVNPGPVLSGNDSYSMCNGDSVLLDIAVSGEATEFIWSPSDYLSNPAILNPYAKPIADQSYVITARSSSGCENSKEILVTTGQYPDISTWIDATICRGKVIEYAAGNVLEGLEWEPAAGITKINNQFINISPEVTTEYSIRAWNGNCVVEKPLIITVINSDGILFSNSYPGLNVTFTANVTGEDYNWSFGDGGISNIANPTHQFAAPGEYMIYLRVRTQCGRRHYLKKIQVVDSADCPN